MRTKSVDITNGRVPLETLLKYAEDMAKYNAESGKTMKDLKSGLGIRECSVNRFYSGFLRLHSSDKYEAGSKQRWIADCIEVMLGEADTGSLTMGELADKIAIALNTPKLSSEDRWALYELCFMLTAQMRIGLDDSFRIIEQTTRLGTPDEKEPWSLYNRVIALRHSGRTDLVKKPEIDLGSGTRVSLKQILRSVEVKENCLTEKEILSLPFMKAEQFVQSCQLAKHHSGLSPDGQSLELYLAQSRFEEMVRQYSGNDWKKKNTISKFAESLTSQFRERTEMWGLSRNEVLQAYELCYEFITLMADEASCEGHESLMMIEGLDSCCDVDAKVRAGRSTRSRQRRSLQGEGTPSEQ